MIKSSHVVIKNKIDVICLQPPIGLKLNDVDDMVNSILPLLKKLIVPFSSDNTNNRK